MDITLERVGEVYGNVSVADPSAPLGGGTSPLLTE